MPILWTGVVTAEIALMIKKFVSRALLSMVMDKKAREALDKRRTVKTGGSAATPSTDGAAKKGKSAAAAAPAAPAPPGDDLLDDLPETLIRQAIDEAEQEISRRKVASGGGPGSERARLIQEALDIQKRQSKLLDELPREQREKLVVMAHQALVGDVEKARGAKPKAGKAKKKPPRGKG